MNSGLIDPRMPDALVEQRWGQHIKSKDPVKRRMIAQHMERQARYMEGALADGSFGNRFRNNDPTIWSTRDLLELTQNDNIADFIQQQIAMVEAVFERIVIDQLVHVQAMTGPKAFVHSLSYEADSAYDGVGPPAPFNAAIDPDYADIADDDCSTAKGADLKITSETITAKTKRLKAKFSVAAEQDLQSQYRIGLADRLRSFLALELQREIQQTILVDIINNAGNAANWNSNPPAGSVYENLDPKVWQSTLYDALQSLDADIFSSTDGYRGANWISGNPAALLYLEELRSFSINTNEMVPRDRAGESDIDMYSNLMGTANGRWKVWKLPFQTGDKIILGTKSDAPQETAYIHGTYVPISDLGTFRNPSTACVEVGVMTRVADKMIRPGLFGVLTLTHV
tara:strand:- start:7936 stop:9129 length:1194 start_codon:yes stop_codon:yes gene_type:complete